MPKSKQLLRVKAREYGEQQIEALGFPARMEFELEDGSVVELMHPWLWDDEAQSAYDAIQNEQDQSGESRVIRIARAVLGEEDHQRFVAGGGKSSQILLAIEMMRQRRATADGDGPDPKGKPS
jgi:hypothetical protein